MKKRQRIWLPVLVGVLVVLVGIAAAAAAIFDNGVFEVVLNGKTGYVTAPQDVDAVVARSRELLNDAALRAEMGKNGKDLVIERFAWRRMADILEEEFLMLLKEKSCK